MFRKAIAIAQNFTFPVVISRRSVAGICSSSIGSFVVINPEGWVVTAAHLAEQILQFDKEVTAYKDYEKPRTLIEGDRSLSKAKRIRQPKTLSRPAKESTALFSTWWGRDGWIIDHFTIFPDADIAIGKIVSFDPSIIAVYPTFKDPSNEFEVGTSLCKLGFSFHNIIPIFDKRSSNFTLPPSALPLPYFPIDGIFTRTVVRSSLPKRVQFVETSSPGLPGQSGGPIFDIEGQVWAIQSHTTSYHLGFSPTAPDGTKYQENQFLHVGRGTHVGTVIQFLNEMGIELNVSTS